jgi:hypothetical protein
MEIYGIRSKYPRFPMPSYFIRLKKNYHGTINKQQNMDLIQFLSRCTCAPHNRHSGDSQGLRCTCAPHYRHSGGSRGLRCTCAPYHRHSGDSRGLRCTCAPYHRHSDDSQGLRCTCAPHFRFVNHSSFYLFKQGLSIYIRLLIVPS